MFLSENDFYIHITMKQISVYSSSSLTNEQQKNLAFFKNYIFSTKRSSLFFYDNTIFHLLIASKVTPKKYWYYFYIFIGIFFSIGNKESARNGYSFACPFILCPTFSPTPIIYEHIHAIVFLLSVYLQFSIHFNLWFCVIKEWRSFFSLLLLLKTIK